jgi:indolepyruvate ferredoxin oxidoreductase, beta subunit
MTETTQPVAILIAALGGEGGGVLCEWLVDAATRAGFPVQGTSIPGVAQRTGATTYYVEIFPTPLAELGSRRVVLSLYPVPGRVDLVVASELLEAARVVQSGLCDPHRTTLIASSSRTLTTVEKIGMGDTRLDHQRLVDAVTKFSRRSVLVDMEELARRHATVASSVLFGAISGSGLLPFAREHCEASIAASGRAKAASLAGFAAGYQAVAARLPRAMPLKPKHPDLPHNGLAHLPLEVQTMIEIGKTRTGQYQDARYAEVYVERVARIAALEESLASHDATFPITRETARFLALWMTFDDIIKVAGIKTDKGRFARVASEVAAGPGDLVQIHDFFKPRAQELAQLLPEALAQRIERWNARRSARGKPDWSLAMELNTTSVTGFAMLRLVAGLKRLRRVGARYTREQAGMQRWLAAIERIAPNGCEAALEVALCARLVKGYGATNERGQANLFRILDTFAGDHLAGMRGNASGLAQGIARARSAALEDPEGRALDRGLASFGATPRALVARPLKFMKPIRSVAANSTQDH